MRGLLLLLGLAVAAGLVLHLRSGSDDLSPPGARVPPEEPSGESLTLVGVPPAARAAGTRESAPAEPDAEEEAPAVAVESKAPEDPPQVGPCRLDITCVDDTTEAAPVQTEIALWRLNAPGNQDWTHGDQLQRVAQTDPEGRLRIEALPEGRYRFFVRELRDGADDPPAFEVSGPESQLRVVLPMPRTFRVRVRLVDAQGLPVRQARLRVGGRRRMLATITAPDWRVPRMRCDGPPPAAPTVGGRGSGSTASGGWARQTRDSQDGIFDLEGVYREPVRWSRSSSSYTLQGTDGGTFAVRVDVEAPEPGPDGDRTYLGVLVPIAELATRVVLPDGRRALDAGARVVGSCQSMRVLPDTPFDAWRRVPIDVGVILAGYRTLAFVTDLDGPPPRWTMTPLVEGEAPTGPDPGLLTSRRGEEALPSAPAPR